MNRSEMREQALILLFEKEFFKDMPAEEIENIYSENVAPLSEYGKEAFESTLLHRDELDEIIAKYSTSRRINRIPKINLSILRLALYEMIYSDGVPAGVAVNEAVELAKKYSGQDDYQFINGILGSYIRNK
ncbi:MAG: transcription antitermination factor NusB [Eubacterium sp.]|nr:transcription antitermination factor NusB [Eubacterium sp.]